MGYILQVGGGRRERLPFFFLPQMSSTASRLYPHGASQS
jgi:hypothetical protein